MKRILCLISALCLLLSGCSILGERIKEPVTFYYIRSDYASEMTDIIASEEREASGHRQDLSYLLALYLMGPSADDLVSPIPRGTLILSVEQTEKGITVCLSNTDKTMTDMEFSLACACLSLTCLELTDSEQTTIVSGDRTVTLGRDSLILLDENTTAVVEEET